jgi:hypothetical protein
MAGHSSDNEHHTGRRLGCGEISPGMGNGSPPAFQAGAQAHPGQCLGPVAGATKRSSQVIRFDSGTRLRERTGSMMTRPSVGG